MRGAVIGGLIAASRRKPRARALSVAAIGWGMAISAAALAPTLALELAALVFVGYGSITFNSMAKTTLQLAAIPIMRGRVMALWALAWLGSTPIGGPIVGWVGQTVRRPLVALIGGLPTVLIGLAGLAGAQADRPASGVQFIPRMRAGRQGCFRPTALPVGGVEDRTRSRGGVALVPILD